MSKGIKIEGKEGLWEEIPPAFDPLFLKRQCTGELALYRLLPDPKPMPELKPGMLVRSDLGAFAVLCDECHETEPPYWDCWDNRNFARIIHVDSICEIFDKDKRSIWKRDA